MNHPRLLNAVVFVMLVGLGVLGRLLQPEWCVTPIAAIGLFCGFFFASRAAAMLVPLIILTVSDLWLPAYTHAGVHAVVYVAFTASVLLGWDLRRRDSRNQPIAFRLGIYGFMPATIFWLATNLAVWYFQSNYPMTAGGLLTCYAAAIPFYRNMLAGDLFYLSVIFGAYALAARSASSAESLANRPENTSASSDSLVHSR